MLVPIEKREGTVDKLIRHYKAIEARKIDLKELKLHKMVGKEAIGLKIKELLIENIMQIIEENKLDPEYNMYSTISKVKTNARKGKVTKVDRKKLTDAGIVTEEDLMPIEKQSYARRTIMHLQALIDSGIDVENLSLTKSIDRKMVNLKLEELAIDNIEEIIKKYNLDPKIVLQSGKGHIRDKFYNDRGKLTVDEIRDAKKIPRTYC